MKTVLAMAVLATSAITATAAEARLVPAGDPAFVVEGAGSCELVDDADGKRLRLKRPLDMPGKGYGWDNPGATVRFRSDARTLAVRLRFSEKHVSTSARNGTGLLLVDGAWKPGWTFDAGITTVQRAVAVVEPALPVPAAAGLHEYTVVMPYGDSVEFAGVLVGDAGTVSAPAARTRPRWVAYGDSVTQGFDGSHVGAGYPWQVAQRRGWEVVNLGLGGRTTTPADADAIAGLKPALVTVAIGVNDWQGGVPAATYGERLADLLRRLRSAAPAARIAVITPLWVGPSWKPDKATAPLEDYRVAARAAVKALRDGDQRLELVDGPGLIDQEPSLFNRVAVHPNDAGFAQMADRLAGRVFPDQNRSTP